LTPLISIIVPNYNHYNYLQQRLESIFNQTYQNFEVILLDDCSTDASVQLLQTYANHPKVSHFIINKQNSGSPFKQWQKGIDLAKGDYIWIAESDDYCNAAFLEKMMELFNEDKNAGIAYCQTIDVNDKGETLLHRIQYTKQFKPNIWEHNFVIEGISFVKNYMSVKNVIPNASALIFKKELVDSHIFSKSLLQMKMCGDWFFWIQLSLKTKVAFLAEALNYFRNHEGISRNHYTTSQKKLRLLEEKEVLDLLFKNNFYNVKSEANLYQRWFALNGFSSLFSSMFYHIKLEHTSFVKFVFYFIQFKLRKKLQ